MAVRCSTIFVISSFLLVTHHLFVLSQGDPRVGFYSKTCPNAEAIVHDLVVQKSQEDVTNIAALLRLHFHDCFVHGCDGSILIDNGLQTDERHAFGHLGLSLRSFDIVEMAKARLEKACPGIVSCADIVALVARDAVSLARGPFYAVETGRRDGRVSNVTLADKMPDVTDNIQKLKALFFEKGLSEKDLVVLSGAHTIGTTACFFMMPRLYGYPSSTRSDPSINPRFEPELRGKCPNGGSVDTRLDMDRGSGLNFDDRIFRNVRSGFAVLQSDAALYQDEATKRVVDSYLGSSGGSTFEADFAASMVKMGRIGALTGSQGEIRRVCSSFN